MKQQQQITPIQAFNILSAATEPQQISKLNRMDFVNIQIALEVLKPFIEEHYKEPTLPALEVVPDVPKEKTKKE